MAKLDIRERELRNLLKQIKVKDYKKIIKGKYKGDAYRSQQYDRKRLINAYTSYYQRESFEPKMMPKEFIEQLAKRQTYTDKLYNTYLKTYENRAKRAEKYGVTMDRKLKKNEFISTYYSTQEDLLRMVESGERKTTGAITRDIVEAQVNYDSSTKQAAAAMKYIKKQKMEYQKSLEEYKLGKIKEAPIKPDVLQITYKDIRLGNQKSDIFWDMIRADRKKWAELGLKKSEIRQNTLDLYFPDSPTMNR